MIDYYFECDLLELCAVCTDHQPFRKSYDNDVPDDWETFDYDLYIVDSKSNKIKLPENIKDIIVTLYEYDIIEGLRDNLRHAIEESIADSKL